MDRYGGLLKKSPPQEKLTKYAFPPVRYGVSYDPGGPGGVVEGILVGASVMTLKPLHNEEYIRDIRPELGRSLRKWGVEGVVRSRHDSHGVCYEVVHKDGTFGCYDRDEIRLILR